MDPLIHIKKIDDKDGNNSKKKAIVFPVKFKRKRILQIGRPLGIGKSRVEDRNHLGTYSKRRPQLSADALYRGLVIAGLGNIDDIFFIGAVVQVGFA